MTGLKSNFVKASLCIIIFLFCNSTVQAQGIVIDNLHDYCWLCHNKQHLAGRVYYHSFNKELPFLLSSGALLVIGLMIDNSDKTKPFSEDQLNGLNKNKINSFDRPTTEYWSQGAAQISNYSLIGISLLPVLFLSERHTSKDIKSLALMTFEAFALNYGVTYIVKSTVNRTRPYVYNTDLPLSVRTNKESRKSFYSGHTSQAATATFLFAKVISDYHPDLRRGIKTGIWTVAITAPALEAYLRVKGGRHYPTDVIAGYVMGAFSGFIIPEMHRNFNYASHKKSKLDVGLLPVNGGMVMNMNLTF